MSTAYAFAIAKISDISDDSLVLQERPIPIPKSTEVLVKVHAVSLNYRDLMIISSAYRGKYHEGIIPTSDGAGEIVEVGEDVKGWKKGQRVCVNFYLDHIDGDPTAEILPSEMGSAVDGMLTEYRAVPAHSLVEIPEHLSYEEASTLPCAALTAYNALLGSKPLKGGDYVLVLGAGGVSIFALQIAVASGATVIATSSSDTKLEIAKKLGAKHVINYKNKHDWDKEVLNITGGRGVDHVVEVGGAGTLARSSSASKYAGHLHLIGFVSQDEDNTNIVVQTVSKALVLRGILIGSVAQFRAMNRLLSAHQIHPQVDKVFPFEEAIQAYKYLQSQQHIGKVVIKVSKD